MMKDVTILTFDDIEKIRQDINEEDYEEVNEATELWNDLRAFIAKGE